MTQRTTLGNSTMALFTILALNQEHLMICLALQVAHKLQLNVHGCIVDSVLFTASEQQMLTLQHRVANMKRPDGSAILQVKDLRNAPASSFLERVVAPKTSHWRPFTACTQPRRFKSKAFGQWMHDPAVAQSRE